MAWDPTGKQPEWHPKTTSPSSHDLGEAAGAGIEMTQPGEFSSKSLGNPWKQISKIEVS